MEEGNNDSYASIYSHQVVNDLYKALQINQVILNVDAKDNLIEIEKNQLRKACWLISILAESDNDIHKQKADDIAKLLFLQNSQNPSIATYADFILRRTGNLPAIKHLKELSFAESGLDAIATQEALIKKHLGKILVGNQPYFLSDFQVRLWAALNKNKDVLISGPTSSGKSFIIKTFLFEKLHKLDTFFGVYVVPSRALINQVVEDLSISINKQDKINIRTSFEDDNPLSKQNKIIYVVTPERCIKLLERGHLQVSKPDFIFIDEIQNVDRDDDRALLYDILISESKLHWRNVQLVLAGPYISNLERFYHEILPNSPVIGISSEFSPVVHNYVTIQPDKALSQFNLSVWTHSGKAELVKLCSNDIRLQLSQSKGAVIARVIMDIAIQGPNLVYCAQSNYATDWAVEASKIDNSNLSNPFPISQNVADFISFLKSEFHPDYYLSSCIAKGIAYHHSRLPDIVRLEIEDLFANKFLRNLYCTSTLLEGVNLPAANIFITTPKKKDYELTKFEFGNLKGRAGRIGNNLQGSVYCIEILTQGEEGWSDKYMEGSSNLAIHSRYSSSNFPSFNSLAEKLELNTIDIEESSLGRFILHLRNKFIRDPKGFYDYLKIGFPDDSQRDEVFNKISGTINSLSVPREILLKNPSIDPLLQNKLYEFIVSEGEYGWVFHEGEHLFGRMSRSTADNFPIVERSLFYQLEYILKKLDQIFNIYIESRENTSQGLSISKMALHTTRWLAGEPYRKMIEEDIKYYSSDKVSDFDRIDPSDPKAINSVIGRMIKINSQVVTFVVVKYLKLLSGMLETILSPEKRDKYNFTITLPAKIEFGTYNKRAMELVINGVPRSIAVEVIKRIPKGFEGDAFEWLKSQTGKSLKIHSVYIKHLIKLGFINN